MSPTEEINWLKMEEYSESLREEIGLPGLSLGILSNDMIQTAGFGVGNIEKGTPVWGETLFQIGSITKTFTAALVMQAVESGKLDLDQPVSSYIPGFRVADEAVSEAVTLRHLLTHSGGWDGDVFLETGDGEDAIHKYVPRLSDREQLFSPGEVFSYNNSGFAILGSILERVHDLPMETLLRERIFNPVGMERAYLNTGEMITEDFAVGHHDQEGKIQVARPWRLPRAVLPVGGIITNVEDLLQYARCLLNEGKTASGEQIVSAKSLAEMWSPQIGSHAGDRTSIGLSWMLREYEDGFMVSHSGGTNGQTGLLTILPNRRFAVAILTNGDTGRTATRKITAFALSTYLGIEMPIPTAIDSTFDELSAYAGSAARPGFELHLKMLGEHLVGLMSTTIGFPTENDPPPPPEQPFRVGRCEADRLIILEGRQKGIPIDVLRGKDGKTRFLRFSSRIYGWLDEK